MTFGVVVISILLQGFTAAPLLRPLGLAGQKSELEPVELAKAKLLTIKAGRAKR